MQKVVIIGRNSYLAAGLQSHLENCAVSWLDFNDWRDNMPLLAEADWIINFAMSPACYEKDMLEEELIDVQIARCIKDFSANYIFISSRKVYGQSSQCLCHKETDPLIGQDWYARNKIKTEQRLKEILPGRLTILRISNVLGEPVLRKGYKTFIGWICENFLQSGKLIVTQNMSSVKDFVTKAFIHENIAEIIKHKILGTFNLSSGIGISVRELLAGYVGEANLIDHGNQLPKEDQFILDNTLLSKYTGKTLTRKEIQQDLSSYHQQLEKIRKDNIITEQK